MIILTALVCWWPGFFANRAETEMANAMSGLVSTIENMMEPVMLWYFSFSAVVASLSMQGSRRADSFIRMVAAFALSR